MSEQWPGATMSNWISFVGRWYDVRFNRRDKPIKVSQTLRVEHLPEGRAIAVLPDSGNVMFDGTESLLTECIKRGYFNE
jgi:hypothetical protein